MRNRGRAADAAGKAVDGRDAGIGRKVTEARQRRRGQDTENNNHDHKFDEREAGVFTYRIVSASFVNFNSGPHYGSCTEKLKHPHKISKDCSPLTSLSP